MDTFWLLSRLFPVLLLTGIVCQSGCEKSVPDALELASPFTRPTSAPPSGYAFEKPIRIRAAGEYVSVESPGYACPTIADVDGDGKEDLVVGQFSQGNMQFFKNVSRTGHPPEFARSEWIKTGNERAVVPGVW